MSEQEIGPANLLRIAVLCGSDDERSIIWTRSADIGSVGNNDSWRLINALDNTRFGWRRTHITPGYFRQPRRWTFDRFSLVWNMITDPDQNPATLEVATKLLADVKLPVINRPSLMALTRRDRMAERLQGTPGVLAPKVLLVRNPSRERIARAVDAAGFRFPAIVRHTGTQSGRVLGLFDRLDDLQPIFGDRRNEYFMTEYYDLRCSDGYYRKLRLMFIGDKIIYRQHIISDRWNIHGADEQRVMAKDESLRNESREALLAGFDGLPSHIQQTLLAIRQRVPLEYYGFDGCIGPDGRLVLFEVNATMNYWPHYVQPNSPVMRALLEPAIDAIARLVEARAEPITFTRPAATVGGR